MVLEFPHESTAVFSREDCSTSIGGLHPCHDIVTRLSRYAVLMYKALSLPLHRLKETAPAERRNMVNVAQLVRASDCGSEGRGFEPHLSPLFVEKALCLCTKPFLFKIPVNFN